MSDYHEESFEEYLARDEQYEEDCKDRAEDMLEQNRYLGGLYD